MRTLAIVTMTALLLTGSLGLPSLQKDATIAAPTWASLSTATIQPGVQMVTGGAQCTSNFVFYDDDDIYIGYAAHCAGKGGSTDTNGCLAGSQPLGTKVSIDGAQYQGTLAYSSWDTMIKKGQATSSDACKYNDFALVKLDSRDHNKVNPSVLHFGGPTALCAGPGFGEELISYGNSGLRFGLDPVAPKTGISLGTSGSGWTTTVYMATPGVPGDSGSGYMTSDDHCAFGVTSTVALFPYALSNGISSLEQGIDYMEQNTNLDVELGTAAPITSFVP
ncbi:MAG: serine protease [Thermoplasmatota archaeon]